MFIKICRPVAKVENAMLINSGYSETKTKFFSWFKYQYIITNFNLKRKRNRIKFYPCMEVDHL